ncbi:MAG: UDP-N-acetylglucosamine 4,6-dehydratase [Candidatus Marinimicrobia bacterium]|nr:UDP-N-acetylglucosamine 4,6-dehydratase [Candidatus Neomarinimicrobiota bacterium]|tara:strand:+ start:41212 stop:42402 length:1191 start_codon:yes stop_codon:yes gene_type:complete
MMNIFELIGRKKGLFSDDIFKYNKELSKIIEKSSFLVLGAAGSIGQALTKEIFQRNPKKLHLVDISENNLVEVVRDLRSSSGYIKGEFKTFALDIGSKEYEQYIKENGRFNYIFNLSALKHVRSESDPYTLMRMINVNIVNTINTIDQSINNGVKKYFCVSTDKAANPVSMMGASKRIMEYYLMQKSNYIDISTARFANVAFSDGSLLYGFNQRIQKKQPLSAPSDIRRYFLVPSEAGELCLLSGLLGKNKEIFFPKLNAELNLISFRQIAIKYLNQLGYKPLICKSEDEARRNVHSVLKNKRWPCYFFKSDTTGEKDFEEFFTEDERIDFSRFNNIGIIKNELKFNKQKLDYFLKKVEMIKSKKNWFKKDIIQLFDEFVPNFKHIETNKYLDDKM